MTKLSDEWKTPKWLDRFLDKITFMPSGCWRWNSSLNNMGYGQFYLERKSKLAHRVSYWLHFHELDPTLSICHKCDITCCVNPNHLFQATRSENAKDMVNKGRRYNVIPKGSNRVKLFGKTWIVHSNRGKGGRYVKNQ